METKQNVFLFHAFFFLVKNYITHNVTPTSCSYCRSKNVDVVRTFTFLRLWSLFMSNSEKNGLSAFESVHPYPGVYN